MTNDADIAVVVDRFAEFERVKDQLASFGFSRTRLPYRLLHQTGGLLDLLPSARPSHPMVAWTSVKASSSTWLDLTR